MLQYQGFKELMRFLTSPFLALLILLLLALLVPQARSAAQPCAAASLSPLSLHVGGMDF